MSVNAYRAMAQYSYRVDRFLQALRWGDLLDEASRFGPRRIALRALFRFVAQFRFPLRNLSTAGGPV